MNNIFPSHTEYDGHLLLAFLQTPSNRHTSPCRPLFSLVYWRGCEALGATLNQLIRQDEKQMICGAS